MTPFAREPFDLSLLERALATRAVGRRAEFHPSIGSTNDRALEWARTGAPHGALVMADEQVKGRGRHGRAWHSAAQEGVWASVVLRTGRPAPEQAQLALVVGLAVVEALAEDLSVGELALRWPNDVELRGLKVAGILCERAATAEGDAVVAGMGLNVGPGAVPPELAERAISLAGAGYGLRREPLLAACLGRLEARVLEWEARGFAALRTAYLERCGLPGREARLKLPGGEVVGTVATVDASGALVLRTAKGLRSYFAGEVERVR